MSRKAELLQDGVEDLLVDRIVAECSLILCEAEAPQPLLC